MLLISVLTTASLMRKLRLFIIYLRSSIRAAANARSDHHSELLRVLPMSMTKRYLTSALARRSMAVFT